MTNAEAMRAIEARISARAYTNQPVEQEKLDRLQQALDEANANGMAFQLYGPREGGKPAIDMNAQMFASSPLNYAALPFVNPTKSRPRW